MILNNGDIKYPYYSIVDNVGRVFEFKEKLYRGIYAHEEKNVIELLNCGLIDELIAKQLFPKTTIENNFKVGGYSIILEHEKVFLSNPYEWTFDMLRDAALTTLQVNEIALVYGYQLKDAHSYNILFKNNQPLFVDLGSFIKRKDVDFRPVNEFLKSFCLPLILFSHNQSYLVHKLILDPSFPDSRLLVGDMPFSLYKYLCNFQALEVSVKSYKLKLPLNRYTYLPLKFISRVINRTASKIIKTRFLLKSNIKKSISQITYNENTIWSNYQTQYLDSTTIQSTERFNYIVNFTKLLGNIHSALDVAANQGLLPILLYKNAGIKKLYHLDYDIQSNNKAYLYYKKENIPVNVICANFRWIVYDNDFCARLKSDIVYGLALTHHLILGQKMPLDSILQGFAKITNKYVCIEFMPLGLWNGKEASILPNWYTKEWFCLHFKKYFSLIEERQLEINRIIFIGQKLSLH